MAMHTPIKGLEMRNFEGLEVRTSKGLYRRACSILKDAVKRLEAAGFCRAENRPSWQAKLAFVCGEHEIALRIFEVCKNVKTSENSGGELIPTGALMLVAKGNWISEISVGEPVELGLERLVDRIQRAIARREAGWAKMHAEDEERRRESEARRRLEMEERRRQMEREARSNDFSQRLADWHICQRAERYIQAIRDDAIRREIDSGPETELGKWLAWADAAVKDLNPVRADRIRYTFTITDDQLSADEERAVGPR